MILEQFTTELRREMFDNRINTSLNVKGEHLGINDLEKDFSSISEKYFIEIPPINNLEDIIKSGGVMIPTNDLKGYWSGIIIKTYLDGGKIWYRKIDKENLEVKIFFDGTNPNLK